MTELTRTLRLFAAAVLCLLLTAPTHAQTVTINEARNQGTGATVTVKGTVTRAFGDFVRFQDGSGPTGASGLVVRQTDGAPETAFRDSVQSGAIRQGTRLQVTGTLTEFNGLLQINSDDDTDDLESFSIEEQGALPDSQVVTLATLKDNGEDYESELVRVTGLDFLTASGTFSSRTTYSVTDESGTSTFADGVLNFRVQGSGETALIGEPIPTGAFAYTGVLSEFHPPGGFERYQLIPVRTSDVQVGPSFAFARLYAQSEEGDGPVEVNVKPFATGGSEVSVRATLGDGSTADVSDVSGFDGSKTFTFSESSPAPQTLSITPTSDTDNEGVERLEVVLETIDGTPGRPERFTLWILDDPAAQVPIAEGDSGDALVSALQQRYGDPRPLGYDFARDTMYARIYNDASNTVEGTYSGFTRTVDPTQGDPSTIAAQKGINTEHTWPQSEGADQEPATSNLHILVPTRAEVNSARSNLPYGESPDEDTDTWYFEDQSQSNAPPEADQPLWSEVLINQKFEPRHSVKGDVARAAFYFVTMYPNRANFSFFDAQRDTLLAWHERDPVDATEMRRNLVQASYQDNAVNPFVMDSTLADRAYGSGAGTGEPAPPTATYELVADEAALTPSGGQAGVQCLVQRSSGDLVFFNSNAGGVFSWSGSSLVEERSASAVNSDISGETNTIDRCDGVTVDADGNVYFLFRADGSSSQNSWPTYVYKLPASGTPSVLASEDGLQGVAHDAGTVYLSGVEFRGAPEDGVYSVDDAGTGQSLTTVVQDPDLDLNYGMEADASGDLYAYSGFFAAGDRQQKIVRVNDPSGSATLETFVDPYRSGSPLIAGSPNDISDLRVVNYAGVEYLVVYNGSFQAQDGDQWATIRLSDSSIELLFNRTDLLNNIPESGYTSAFTRPLAVNESGAVFTASRFRDDDSGNVQSRTYIAKVSNAPPLPVELASFDAVRSGGSVELTWTTASETNNASFTVERKRGEETGRGGEGWEQIGSVKGAGTTETPRAYRFTDANVPFEADALTYRLRQVDLDGSVSYSEPVTVQRAVEGTLLRAPFPNPARRQATVQFAVPERQEVTLRLYDMLGRQVRTLVDGARAGRQQAQVDVSGLSSGVYFLRLQAGLQSRTKRLTVVQ